jgi:hypothetical protein
VKPAWIALLLLVVAGLGLRFNSLGDIHLWPDETDFFDRTVYREPPEPLVEHALLRAQITTNSVGWFAVVWISARTLGGGLTGARACTAIAGSLAIPALFLLCFVAAGVEALRSRLALTVAALATISIPLIEFSQRTYAYGAVPFFVASLLIAHVYLTSAIESGRRDLSLAWIAFSAAATLGLFVHPSFVLILASCLPVLCWAVWKRFQQSRQGWLPLCVQACVAAVPVIAAGVINAKQPGFGNRPYLTEYYPPPGLESATFFLSRAYDLAAYLLNLFFEPSLYWPLAVNPAIFPLVLLCAFGWAKSMQGGAGPRFRQLAVVAVIALMLQAAFSIFKMFPFGGVRQSLFHAPLAFVFTGIGAQMLWMQGGGKVGKYLCVLLGVGYVSAWAWCLPSLYKDRIAVYSGKDVLELWSREGHLPVYTLGGSEDTIRYLTRDEKLISVKELGSFRGSRPVNLEREFLLISTMFPVDESWRNPNLLADMQQSGLDVQLLEARPAIHSRSVEHRTMLYFPPNGFWVYRVSTSPTWR